ncbi:helix-turn-helix domain-containing protein [Clostridium saccharobutylicum]|uniref:Transcription factor n=1 Tax=Clostridium saccharobutylicum DSM 13864 TaxID=1345695 RepID=U5MTY4_CLOSA|nr:helix-turn-helix transcriptional regulator [Clostridium saccharobutylicum]AGX43983.1 transcription factor [Clostridium saccharobutylicum DSM 13864]AQR91279.1 helix-turn-helix protein [Clostridium saccharobutylicum]AQS01183.1 helix-turn-helix protein [Clostridium saccharobutylicum]AQS15166.1 helix-turn-helix protein [Clostridium saccharobutylicum]MBA2905293.1 transcriptional regulator with XRE-family HTH domain [Clostridium saccharobutylicum]
MILLRKLRQEKGLSIEKLAKEIDIKESTIRNIENKIYKASNENSKKFAKYFNVSDPKKLTENVDELIKEKRCLNQRCPLNKECYCQSDQVIAGEYCKSQKLITDKSKKVSFNNTQALFVE